HHRLKMMSTQLNISMQQATEEAVAKWLDNKEAEHNQQLQVFKKIEGKLDIEERKVLEALLAKKMAQ
ncbi:MAG: hypothetical protein KKA19_03630, partial [Candidatus Margulisbacteria bacterium]|nr:hypothetical protein [Candidatus Margulisiibacteriota bacterium]